MALQNGQPTIRFDLAGPFGFQGISFVPKVLTFHKDAISGTSNNDFWVAPAGTFISRAVVITETALNGSGTVELGTDGTGDELIDTTSYDPTSDAFGTNIGSATATAATGLYLAASDTIRLTIGGTPTQGAVFGFIEYYETADMASEGIHFEIA